MNLASCPLKIKFKKIQLFQGLLFLAKTGLVTVFFGVAAEDFLPAADFLSACFFLGAERWFGGARALGALRLFLAGTYTSSSSSSELSSSELWSSSELYFLLLLRGWESLCCKQMNRIFTFNPRYATFVCPQKECQVKNKLFIKKMPALVGNVAQTCQQANF